MLIYIDQSETKTSSLMPSIPNAIIINDLEEITGADFMLSPLPLPIAEGTIPLHLEVGAIMIQLKIGGDLFASLGSRLNMSLAKMNQFKCQQWQRVLLSSIDTYHDENWYDTFETVSRLWSLRGGVAMLTTDIEQWIETTTNKMKDTNPKIVYPVLPHQDLLPIKDARITIATLPGIGVKTAEKLWKEFDGNA